MNVPNGWHLEKLSDISEKIMVGIASSATHAYRDAGVVLLRNLNIKENYIDAEQVIYIDPEYEKQHRKKRLKIGDVITVRTGYPGVSAVVTPHFEGAQCFTSLITRPINKLVDSKFLSYYINSEQGRRFITSGEAGGAQKNVNVGVLSKMPVLLPPLAEQKKITEILGTWDEAIAQVEQLIAALQWRKKGLMQRLLTGQVRFDGFDDEWREIGLREFLTYTPRKVLKPSEPYIRMGLRSHGKGTFTSIVEDPDSNAMNYLYQVKGDDLIVNITFAWEQAIAIVSDEDENALVSHRFPTYVFNRNVVISEFFRYLMLTPRFKYMLGIISPGGAGRNRVMSKTDFLKLKILIPPVEEQEKIGGLLMTHDKYINLLFKQLEKLKEQKKGLMQRLLTGQIRVKTPLS